MGRKFAGVQATSKTTIEIAFTYRGVRCRERIKFKPTPANLKAASRHREAVLDAIERNTFDYAVTFPNSPRAALFSSLPGRIISIKTYLDEWLKQARCHLKTSTWNDYRKTVNNHLIPIFGHINLSDLKRTHIKEWASTLDVSNKRISNLLSPLRVALQEAVDDELIESNPLYGWAYKRKEAPKSRDDIDPFTQREQTAILSKLSGQGKNLIQFAFWTGMRTSELVALKWGDLDWQRNIIRVSRAQTQVSNEAETTKTKAGIRDIKLLPLALEALQSQKQHSMLHPSECIFLNPRTEEPWSGDQPIRKTLWTHALKRAGVRYRRPYQTRHTYASMMLSAGESPLWVAQQMGHSDWTMIARVYGRWIPDADPNAGNKAAAIFGTNSSILPASSANLLK